MQVKTFGKPKIKKRIENDPNTRFSNIKQIMKTIQEAKEETERIRAKEPELMAKKAADEALKAGFNRPATYSEWNLNPRNADPKPRRAYDLANWSNIGQQVREAMEPEISIGSKIELDVTVEKLV
ncbi:uncharacterized protein ATNIH1004_011705 [Aspergillus tanneri]|uniref:Uncharacterized protein n=1 Tax=Aspergillus tanneri TaxID=1220188 RepID=A0A5M9MAK0_9EURO|nr:uncharacterized protein ATNIH1004_011705 [Aspergillus tanneri]KAA8641569.1 hypothetical protein ATNIH1004_011705 [Aspergillus tanneri]